MSMIDIGAVLPTTMDELTDPRTPGVSEAARAVEERGLESLWVADLVLGDGTPALEPALTLAAVASVTRTVRLGFGVLSVPPRPAPWLAAQIATLQHLSDQRILLGVGSAGSPTPPCGGRWASPRRGAAGPPTPSWTSSRPLWLGRKSVSRRPRRHCGWPRPRRCRRSSWAAGSGPRTGSYGWARGGSPPSSPPPPWERP
ncbi:LLM class flavin-dependent oxidoreductase [Nocardiopsis prasina]|uniref:LLM class flavin-dependent oxidoreductase n=1 Tax=Nocardiopsis prasina TaxID=2015 RepID=UPI0003450706|nr:LLM class flavin-dependent oxidoreductase [Nocardiopsis prasina]